jgi:hypothetical protein
MSKNEREEEKENSLLGFEGCGGGHGRTVGGKLVLLCGILNHG